MTRFLRIVTSVTLAASVHCGASTDPLITAAGTYALVSVNGRSLPYIVRGPDGSALELDMETLTLSASGAVSRSTIGRQQLSGPFSQYTPFSVTDAGTFALDGSNIHITFSQTSEHPTGTVDAGTLTLTFSTVVWTYQKR